MAHSGEDGSWAAIIVAGGQSRRLGRDKASTTILGSTLLTHTRSAVGHAESVVIGGEIQGGPMAAIAVGLPQTTAPLVATLAVDQIFIRPALPLLLGAVDGHDVALLVSNHQRHYLAAVWQRSSLTQALARIGKPNNMPMKRLFEEVAVVEVPDLADWSFDIDTMEDLAIAAQRLSETEQKR